MNEPKRRGRPPKMIALPVVEQAEPDLIALRLHREYAQALAMRVWNGQSPDTLSRAERFKRVMAALNAQNLPTEGIELP